MRRKKRSSRKRLALISCLEVAVGGAQHAHVDLDLHLAAQPPQPALLQHAQQLGLQLDGDLAHLVEEERAAVGQLEHAGAALIRAGEGAALVAEDLATRSGWRGWRRS